MQKTIPYKSSWMPNYSNSVFNHRNNDGSSSSLSLSWLQSSSSSVPSSSSLAGKRSELVRENAVVVFAKKGCCLGHVVKRLLLTHGVNPLVVDIEDDDDDGHDDHNNDKNNLEEQMPVVFIGGKLFGGLEKVMAAHINGDLVPILRQAGALWL